MSDPFLDQFPSRERGRLERLKERSPQEYEKLREKVKGQPKEIARELAKNAEMADLGFQLETEPHLQKSATEKVTEDIAKHGAESVLEGLVDDKTERKLRQGLFEVKVREAPKGPRINLQLKPGEGLESASGNVAETLPVKPSYQEKFLRSFKKN